MNTDSHIYKSYCKVSLCSSDFNKIWLGSTKISNTCVLTSDISQDNIFRNSCAFCIRIGGQTDRAMPHEMLLLKVPF